MFLSRSPLPDRERCTTSGYTAWYLSTTLSVVNRPYFPYLPIDNGIVAQNETRAKRVTNHSFSVCYSKVIGVALVKHRFHRHARYAYSSYIIQGVFKLQSKFQKFHRYLDQFKLNFSVAKI